MVLLTLFLTVLLCLGFLNGQLDPCSPAVYTIWKNNSTKRSAAMQNDGSCMECDSTIDETWYRIQSEAGSDLPTSCVERFHCCTDYPVWMDGTLPPSDGHIHNRTAKLTGNTCADTSSLESIPIHVKHCNDSAGSYRVYFLRKITGGCFAAYCAGTKARCPHGRSSEDGWYPGCSTDFPRCDALNASITVTAVIHPTSQLREVQFWCNIQSGNIPANASVEVRWSAENSSSLTVKLGTWTVAAGETKHVLYQQDWSSKVKLPVNFWCEARCRGSSYASPSIFKKSNSYWAGLAVTPETLEVNRGRIGTISIKSSIPLLEKKLRVNLFMPQHYSNTDKGKECKPISTDSLPLSTTGCGVDLTGMAADEDWNTYKQKQAAQMKVYGKVSFQTPSSKPRLIVQLQTDTRSSIWKNIQASVQVTVTSPVSIPPSWQCAAYNDPRILTFDQRMFLLHREGEFLMYKNKDFPIQVNTFFEKCAGDEFTCVCGVAVRSGDEVFLLDRCNGKRNAKGSRIGMVTCGSKSMDIRKNGNSYDVTLPTGMVVTAKYQHNYILNLYIKPVEKDYMSTQGLCGNFDRNWKNDCQYHRSGKVLGCSWDAYSTSWRIIKPEESLFNGLTEGIKHETISLYCRCSHKCVLGTNTCPVAEANCTYDQFLHKCRQYGRDVNEKIRERCVSSSRRKKSTTFGGNDFTDLKTDLPNWDLEFYSPTPSWHNGWTETIAQNACIQGILGTPAGKMCSSLDGVDYTGIISSCVGDIKITGDTQWMSSTIEVMKEVCFTAVFRNLDLWNSTYDGGPAEMPEGFKNLFCPSDCNGRGTCIDGICDCEPDFAGDDCSVDITQPPNIIGVPLEGVCDLSNRPCRETPLYGNNFLDAVSIRCKVKVIVITPDGVVDLGKERLYPGAYVDDEESRCPLPASVAQRRKRAVTISYATVYNISVANNGSLFSQDKTIITYNTDCFQCHPDNFTCIFNGKGCFIYGICYTNGTVNPSDPCLICHTDLNQETWSSKCNESTLSTKATMDTEPSLQTTTAKRNLLTTTETSTKGNMVTTTKTTKGNLVTETKTSTKGNLVTETKPPSKGSLVTATKPPSKGNLVTDTKTSTKGNLVTATKTPTKGNLVTATKTSTMGYLVTATKTSMKGNLVTTTERSTKGNLVTGTKTSTKGNLVTTTSTPGNTEGTASNPHEKISMPLLHVSIIVGSCIGVLVLTIGVTLFIVKQGKHTQKVKKNAIGSTCAILTTNKGVTK